MDEIEWWEFDTPEEMAEQVAGDIGFVVESAAEGHDGARIALPGRDGPQQVYRALLAAKGVAWPKVTLLPTHDGAGSSANGDALQALFGPKGATAIKLSGDDRLASMTWPLDLVLLTVGADGSVAGIVPGADMEQAVSGPKGRHVVSNARGSTLTAAALASARAVMIVLSGAEQRATVERAIKDGPLSQAPIGRVLAEIETAVDIFWTA